MKVVMPMNNQILKDVKKHHLNNIMNDLLIHKNATMSELVTRTGLSQPSVRNMVRMLEEHAMIREVGNDESSGGRCAARFAVEKKDYHILCVYAQTNGIRYQLINYDVLVLEETCGQKDDAAMESFVLGLLHKYQLDCCVIAVDGVVEDDQYMTDHKDTFVHHQWVKKLKKQTTIPIYLENDVKMMHLGQYYHEPMKRSVYLHVNEEGIGSSYMEVDTPIYGTNGLLGEIGLIPIGEQSLNQRIRSCQTQAQFNQEMRTLLSIIITMLDPNRIDVSLHVAWVFDEEEIKDNLKRYIHLPLKNNIHIDQDYQNRLFEGMVYTGIKKLMKERIEQL